MSMIACARDPLLRRLGCRQRLQVHDSNVFMVPTENAEEAQDRATRIMKETVTLDAYLNAEGKRGRSMKETH